MISHLGNTDKLSLGTSPYASVPALLADARLASVGELVRRAGGEDTRDEATFRRLCDTVRVDNADQMRSIVHVIAQTLTAAAAGAGPGARGPPRVALRRPPRTSPSRLGNLVFAGFVAATALRAPGRCAALPVSAAGISVSTPCSPARRATRAGSR